ncbi:hypothetical protein ACFOWB_08620 [Chenggangzhangella methanolivorans]|uniref:hypothetical protein n=1 Tax=Chenggangzhangella methanolivorans TaxID=1437009 RepID=UPI00362184A8
MLLFKHASEQLTAESFRALRDQGAWIETDRPAAARAAMGLEPDESLGEPADPELVMSGPGL